MTNDEPLPRWEGRQADGATVNLARSSNSPETGAAARPVVAKILLVGGDLYHFGGAETIYIRVMHLLQQYYDVALVHAGGPLDVERIAAWSGKRLDPERVRFITAPGTRCLPRSWGQWALMRYAFSLRYARQIAHQYDLVITEIGECPIDHPRVLQDISYPLFLCDRESFLHLGIATTNPVYYSLRCLHVLLARAVAGWNRRSILKAETTVNSHWTGEQFRRVYLGSRPQTIHRGIEVAIHHGDERYLPFREREDNFVVIGRVVPSKRIERAIEIVQRLREERGRDVGLHIIGRASAPYARAVRSLLADKPWVTWHTDMSRLALETLVCRNKWGLHCYEYEHYGLAPGEIQMLGCIVFVHDSGGQKEIVRSPELRYCSVEDAVEKIDRVLDDPAMQERLLREGKESSELHRVEDFNTGYLEIVRRLLAKPIGAPASDSALA